MQKCPKCGAIMSKGIRWSRSRKRLKVFYICHDCRLIFYKTDLAENEMPKHQGDT